MGPPCSSKQGAGDRAAQLGAGNPFCVRKGHPLSDNELKSVVDNPVKYGLRPGGSSAILFQDYGCHALFRCLQVVAIPLTICLALVCFFSEKFFGYTELGAHGRDFDIQPQL